MDFGHLLALDFYWHHAAQGSCLPESRRTIVLWLTAKNNAFIYNRLTCIQTCLRPNFSMCNLVTYRRMSFCLNTKSQPQNHLIKWSEFSQTDQVLAWKPHSWTLLIIIEWGSVRQWQSKLSHTGSSPVGEIIFAFGNLSADSQLVSANYNDRFWVLCSLLSRMLTLKISLWSSRFGLGKADMHKRQNQRAPVLLVAFSIVVLISTNSPPSPRSGAPAILLYHWVKATWKLLVQVCLPTPQNQKPGEEEVSRQEGFLPSRFNHSFRIKWSQGRHLNQKQSTAGPSQSGHSLSCWNWPRSGPSSFVGPVCTIKLCFSHCCSQKRPLGKDKRCASQATL